VRHDFFDRWSRLDSPVHRAPAGVKAAAALLVIVAGVTAPLRWGGLFAALLMLLVAVAAASRVPPSFLLKRLLVVELFAAGVVLLAALQPGGLRVALGLVARSTLCLAAMILLTATTPFASLLHLLRRLRVPALLVTVLALMYRYLFVLVDELERMQRARRSRTFGGGRARAWGGAGTLIGQLFVRSTERAERIYAAMCARGWR
jgi:cobalt/nickel transport system permease protein